MTIISTPPLLLDSSGKPANGLLVGRQTARFLTGAGLVTQAQFRAVIVAGEIRSDSGGQLSLPPTPAGQAVELWEILNEVDARGKLQPRTTARTVIVPDVVSVAYTALADVATPPGSGEWMIPPFAQELIDGIVVAQEAADAAELAKAGAESAQTAAVAAKNAAQAVGNTNDTIMKGVAADAGSQFSKQLNVTFLPRWAPFTAYEVGTKAVSPLGATVVSARAFTSGEFYDSSDWTQPVDLLAAVSKETSETAILYMKTTGSDTNDGLTWRKAKKTLAGALAALPVAGGEIQLGSGIFNETVTAEINAPVRLVGRGCAIGGGSSTTLQYAAGVSGIRVNAGGQTSSLSGFRLASLSPAEGTDDGLLIRGHGTIIDELHVEKFGRDGVVYDTTASGNANACTIGRVRSLSNKRHGLYMAGVDANLLTALNLEVVLNGGWGVFIQSSSVYGSVFLSPNIDRNTLGGVADAGTGTRWISPDVEPGPPGYNVTLTGPGIVWEADSRTNPTVTHGPSQRVSWGGVPVGRLPILDPSKTKSMAWTMGVYEANSFALVDDTNAVNILNYRPLTQRFEHLTPVVTKALYQTAVAIPSASSLSFTCSLGNIFVVALTGNVTATSFVTNNVVGSPLVTVTWVQDGVGGRTYTWPPNCRFAGGVAPADSTPNTSTSATFRYDAAASKWYEIGRSVAVPV